MRVRDIETPVGLARAHIRRVPRARGAIVLSHGAGGGINAADLTALSELTEDGWTYVLVEQPWRVAGKRMAPRPPTLDQAWLPVMSALTSGRWRLPTPLIQGGRSAGARVACRTAVDVGVDGVLALSFPLRPPGKPDTTRAPEAQSVLDAGLPLGVVQGLRDPFGSPHDVRAELGDRAQVFEARGDHSFSRHPQDVLDAVRRWLSTFTT
ncbi:alpha/beta family hydrolase [Demetria terragena]|uniref:alpha/beta hydrolase family protein n=1 Tax=Demetria terragena TaxID=63959 RepID=UPI00037CD4EE|nr:alpha/beta family hydrolase [Demetria terragena]